MPRRIHILLQPLEIAANFRGMLVAQLAILLKALADNALEFRGKAAFRCTGGIGAAIQNRIEDMPCVSPSNGSFPVAIS